ncbi:MULTISPECIES: flagellar assembly protein A [unclassified Paludibacterium]|uniref:flagellar assembly protein A n=1 Tax=unclassified Paludibacterium TaxID=2618429 RepID=UPI001C04E0E1|nr:flagellar assembly protein A [Paludibacterium sp. B53371]BEV72059.1 hypothetical protein THUN1379_15410 [Paludibacterium sp. THUN1379]
MQTSQPSLLREFGDPPFIELNEQGVWVDLGRMDSSALFCEFVDRMFAAGYCLQNLDYPAFLRLISQYTPEMLATRAAASISKVGKVRIATGIQPFPANRQALYRNPFLADDSAEYLFEPVMMDKTISVPIYEELEDGTQDVIGLDQKVVQVKATLDFDEFVAAMWVKGIRYGIDEAVVRATIGSNKYARIAVAHALPVTPGKDANLVEVGSQMRRDDAPLKLPNGAIDLRHFGNRFPQVKAGDRLMQKSPRELGLPGFSLSGKPVEPPLPDDFDLRVLAGEGTAIEQTAEGEFIVARINGFLNIDTASNRIAVTEKIINYSGVSLKTTGDIALKGEHFEEHGEIQEKRVVRGKSITVMADVFGEVISEGGTIQLKQNLVGGSAINEDGDIHIDGLTSNATVIAKKGTITLSRAENVFVIGQHIEIESAVNCCIVGEEIRIKAAHGSQMAGRQVHIEQAHSRRNTPTMVSVVLPDLSLLNARINEMRFRSSEITGEIEEMRKKYDALVADPDVRNYLAIAGKVQRKELVLNEEQKANLLKIKARITPSLTAAAAINQQIQARIAEQKELVERASAIRQQSSQATASVYCQIDHLTDDTQIRKLRIHLNTLLDASQRDLRLRLLEAGPKEDQLQVMSEPFIWRPA